MSFHVEAGRDVLVAGSPPRSVSGVHHAAKSWTSAKKNSFKSSILSGAAEAGVDFDTSMKVVTCTTRFAVCFSVVVAILEVLAYCKTGADVLRTSALESIGDVAASCITLYTGYRMARVDAKRYPVGQAKLQSIGCLVFSTVMFALMIANALANIESLIESKDDVGRTAISRFLHETRALGGSFEEWSAAVVWSPDKGEYEWKNDMLVNNPIKQFFLQSEDPSEVEMGWRMNNAVTKEDIVDLAAEYKNDAQDKAKLIFQNGWLAVSAAYKLGIFLYCICYAIPKSKSSVLVALAMDRRNDFICKVSVIVATTLAFWTRSDNSKSFGCIPEEKVDPLVSLLLSCLIIYSWSELMCEHMTTLSQECSTEEFCVAVREQICRLLEHSPCSVSGDDIKSYMSSEKHTIEVAISVVNEDAHFKEVANVMHTVRKALEALDDVERVIVTIKE